MDVSYESVLVRLGGIVDVQRESLLAPCGWQRDIKVLFEDIVPPLSSPHDEPYEGNDCNQAKEPAQRPTNDWTKLTACRSVVWLYCAGCQRRCVRRRQAGVGIAGRGRWWWVGRGRGRGRAGTRTWRWVWIAAAAVALSAAVVAISAVITVPVITTVIGIVWLVARVIWWIGTLDGGT